MMSMVNNGERMAAKPAAISLDEPDAKGMVGITQMKAPHQMRISPK